MPPRSLLLCVSAPLFLVSTLRAAPMAPSGMADAFQVLADLTLIDGACRDEVVDFGIVFRFAARQGLPAVVVMPGGARRPDFEAVLQARQASFNRDELCGEIAANYAEALPGSVTIRAISGPRR